MYKNSPRLGLIKKSPSYIASVTLEVGFDLAFFSVVFFVPFLRARVLKKDYIVKGWIIVLSSSLLFRQPSIDAQQANVPNYAVVQKDKDDQSSIRSPRSIIENDIDVTTTLGNEKRLVTAEIERVSHKELLALGQKRLHAKLLKGRGLMEWVMRKLRDNLMGVGELYEVHNMKIFVKRLPAMVVVGLLYGIYYDIHVAQIGIADTSESCCMKRVYAHAKKYFNEIEHTYSFVQILIACTAFFAHSANDIGNSVGLWAVIYTAWSTSDVVRFKASVSLWQLAVLALTISTELVTYGYNIMKIINNKITYHSLNKGCFMKMGAIITMLVFSQFSLFVSIFMCITGVIVGVELCNGTIKIVNFQRVGLLLLS